MKLESLELLGFKSFLNRTIFKFSGGITSLVGPNGCGKSNIVDAIIWVLGERGTKSLRVKEMGDIIFHGSNGKRPVNMAEVTLNLSNADKEYAIRRRIYRDGTNEYYINGTLVRLKDVQDFFLGTGVGPHSYAIIEQGNIDYFMQMKPYERRVVIEEASGITRFEEKKRDAFLRMEEVKVNLERVDDIHAEVLRNFEKTEGEWQRLNAYNELKEQLRDIDLSLLKDAFQKLEKREAKLQDRLAESGAEIEAKEGEARGIKENIDAKEEELSLTDTVTRQIELDIKEKEKDMESRLLELNYLEEEKGRLGKAHEELLANVADLAERIGRYRQEIGTIARSLGEEQVAVAEEEEFCATLQREREELKAGLEELETEAEDARNRLFVTMGSLTDVKNRILELERMAREQRIRDEKRGEEEKRLRERLLLLEEKGRAFRERLEKEKGGNAQLDVEEKAIAARMDLLVKEMELVRNGIERLKGEKRSKETFLKQLKSYGQPPRAESVPYKKLIDSLRVPKEAEDAIEKFLSAEMEYHVLPEVEGDALAEIADRYQGNFVFFPAKGIFRVKEGEVEVALNWAGSLQEALLRIAEGEEGLFIAGDTCVDSRGLILKMKETKGISIREFREKMKLEKEITGIDDDLGKQAAALNEAQARYEGVEVEYGKARHAMKERESKVAQAEREGVIIETELKAARNALREFASRLELVEEVPAAEAGELASQREWLEKERGLLDEKVKTLKSRSEEVKKAYEDSVVRFHEVSIRLERKKSELKMLQEEEQRKETAAEESEREKTGREQKARELETTLADIRLKMAALEKSHAELSEGNRKSIERYQEIKGRLGDMHMERTALQERLQDVQKEMEKLRSRQEGVERERAVLDEKKNGMRERLVTEYAIESVEDIPDQPRLCSDAEREKLAEELGRIGEVNFRAEKEYNELKERVEFLQRQKADLEQAMDSLKKTITRIDSVSKELFLETFERVNSAFKRFTEALFKGGKGALALNQEANGIDLYVQPPGKKVTRMELLSGGEKALISLSFLLSLIDTKASPFTLMDEIDAPLDDANLFSLLEIVKTITAKTQVILITHNRITMESSDTMYGITMEEEGISKIISVKL